MIEIGGRRIGEGAPLFIIAEIGANFQSLDQARELISASAKAGVDAVKVQTFRAETVALPGATFTLEDGSVISQYEFFKSRELSKEVHLVLKAWIEEQGAIFFSTPGYYDDVDLLEDLGVSLYKIGSDDLTNYPFLRYVAERQKPMIVSTGMCSLGEVEKAVDAITRTGNDALILLHCVVSYPARTEDANLRTIETLRQAFGFPVGFSDHCQGNTAGIASVGLGAVVVEKHLTLDRAAGGPDDEVACEPDELDDYVAQLRMAAAALGDGRKRILATEEKWRQAARKSLVAARDIAAGEQLSRDMVTIKRPSTGLPPESLDLVLGRKVRIPIAANQLISLECLG